MKKSNSLTMCILCWYVYWKGARRMLREWYTCTSEDTRSEGRWQDTRVCPADRESVGLSGCNYRYPGNGFTTLTTRTL